MMAFRREKPIPISVHTPAYRTFLNHLRKQREAVGISQRELGRRLGKHHDYVNKCESGERQLNIVELKDWCDALGVAWVVFLTEMEAEWQK